MSVRLSDTWAMPYSSMNQPTPLVAFRLPGSITVLPSSSFTGEPVSGGSRLIRPFSRTSKAMALARRVDVVLR